MAAAEVTAGSPTLSFSIKRMTEHDLLEVVEIEELSGLSPWGWDAYHKEHGLSRRAAINSPLRSPRWL